MTTLHSGPPPIEPTMPEAQTTDSRFTGEAKPESIRLADALAYCDASVASQVATLLRTRHAEIESLRAQVEAMRVDEHQRQKQGADGADA